MNEHDYLWTSFHEPIDNLFWLTTLQSGQRSFFFLSVQKLSDSGNGYRTIAKLLNAEGSRTAKNKEWKNSNVYAVLKRYAERQARLERQSYTSEMKFSKMKLEWLKD